MSTPSERLEAQVWLESTLPDLPPELGELFFRGVDEYYTHYPTADRGHNILAILHEDNEAFARLLHAVLPADYSLADVIENDLDARVRWTGLQPPAASACRP